MISVPTPFAVGDVNVYLIDDEPLTLVDTGPKTPEAIAALQTGLRKHDYELSDVKRVVLTHAHEDHCGLAKTIYDAGTNVEVWIHAWETGHLFGGLAKKEHKNLLFRAGVPDAVWQRMQDFYQAFRPLTDALENGELSELQDEMEIEFASGALRVLHTPGHTPGSCSLLREANRTVIGGDCVLKRITPNPVLAPDPLDPEKRFHSLGEYLVSLAKIRSFSPTLIYGGHGEPISDYEEIFNRYVRMINDRQTKVLNLIDQTGTTAWKISQELFPAAITEDVHQFLAISEAVAHLDYAESEGKLSIELKDGVEFYYRN